MDQTQPLSPGRPLSPSRGYSVRPRSTDYPASINVSTKSRSQWGRVPFETLKAIIGVYDVARMCVNHKIDEIRSMELMFQPADSVEDDVDDAIDAAKAVLAYPDRELPYESWLSKWLEGAQKYDAAPLYRRRDYNGNIIGLEVVDGTTIYPYIDENGRRPAPPAPAWNQIVHGTVWDWFTTEDLIYTPFRPQDDSPFGLAPIESILLTANTDIRFQWHFLQLFTDGSVPAGFMEVPPDISNPDQVAEWQDYWDAMVMGDQAKLHQLIAVPNGSKFTQTKPQEFDEKFPQYLMMRTCAAYGVVPQDIGLVRDVNRSNGETQVDIQFRVNTLPWVRWVEGTLTRYLQHDIGLPVKVSLDTGRDKEDRLAEAQAHKLYVDMGAESPDEVRVDILGKRVDKERPTPRFYATQRLGPIPLLSIEGVSGITDPDTYGPAKGQKALDQPYVPPIGVIPTPGTTDDQASQAAVDAYQVAARRQLEAQQDPHRESESDREARGAKQSPQTGQAPLKPAPQGSQDQQKAAGQQQNAGQQQPEQPVKKADLTGAEAAELLAFREYVAQSCRRGRWARDFVFKTQSAAVAEHLNRGGRAEVAGVVKAMARKSEAIAPGVKVAGLAVLAADTGRVLMLQRSLAEGDSAAGMWEFPGGHIEGAETPDEAAAREWQEETGLTLPSGQWLDGSWKSGNGVYQGFVFRTPEEAAVPIDDGRDRGSNPDDPDGDEFEALAWWDPEQLTSNPAIRRELAASLPDVRDAIAADVAKANADPKASARSDDTWPGWRYDLAAAAYWAPRIGTALIGAVDVEQIAQQWLAGQHERAAHDQRDRKQRRDALVTLAIGWLATSRAALAAALRPFVAELYTDGYAIGTAAARSLVTRTDVDMGDWAPGEIRAAERLILAAGDGAGLRALFEAAQQSIGLMADSRTAAMARALADAVLEDRATSELGDALRSVLADPGRTGRLALAELTRASGAAASAVYHAAKVATHQWATAGDTHVCVICDENAKAGAVPLGMPFPSGDLWPPAHPGGCRCATIPGPS